MRCRSAQGSTASQPIILIRADGAATLPSRMAPITMPSGMPPAAAPRSACCRANVRTMRPAPRRSAPQAPAGAA